jgi:hypothetical protein
MDEIHTAEISADHRPRDDEDHWSKLPHESDSYFLCDQSGRWKNSCAPYTKNRVSALSINTIAQIARHAIGADEKVMNNMKARVYENDKYADTRNAVNQTSYILRNAQETIDFMQDYLPFSIHYGKDPILVGKVIQLRWMGSNGYYVTPIVEYPTDSGIFWRNAHSCGRQASKDYCILRGINMLNVSHTDQWFYYTIDGCKIRLTRLLTSSVRSGIRPVYDERVVRQNKLPWLNLNSPPEITEPFTHGLLPDNRHLIDLLESYGDHFSNSIRALRQMSIGSLCD